MLTHHICNLLTMLVLGTSALAADPPRRPDGPNAGPPPAEEGPPPRFDRDRMHARPDARPGRHDEFDDGPNARPSFQWRRMTPPEREKLKQFVEEHFPRLAVELDALREKAPRRFERQMNRVAPEMRRLMEISERDPQRGLVLIRERQIAIQLRQSVAEYHQTTDESRRVELREKIRKGVTQEFQSRMERRTAEVREMETRLAELKARLSESSSLREDIISRRVRELLEKPPPPPPDLPDDPRDFNRRGLPEDQKNPDSRGDPIDPIPERGPSEREP